MEVWGLNVDYLLRWHTVPLRREVIFHLDNHFLFESLALNPSIIFPSSILFCNLQKLIRKLYKIMCTERLIYNVKRR